MGGVWHQKRDAQKTPYAATVDHDTGAAIYIHRLRAEKALGRPLPPRAEVHHADGSTNENAPLVICEDRRYHSFLHNRMRVRSAGGDPRTDQICSHCKEVKPFSEFHRRASSYLGLYQMCKACVRIRNAEAHARRRRR